MSEPVRRHYEEYPYPRFPLLASVRTCDTYALNLQALWGRFNGMLPPPDAQRILLAGCGSFSPYPFAVSNPDLPVTALDLSEASLRRARLHCLLHGRTNVRYLSGDLLSPSVAAGKFGLIDAYGVLHHLENPQDGLRALAGRLVPGGVLRVMVYNRYARREEESIRRALRLLKVGDVAGVKSLIRRSAPGSRLRAYSESSMEAGFTAGLADALLHPCVHSYRIDELLGLVKTSGLKLLQFAHYGSMDNVEDEIGRIRQMESQKESSGNFVLYLGKDNPAVCPKSGEGFLVLNPCLRGAVNVLRWGSLDLPPRLGFDNPRLGWRERRFLATFSNPVPLRSLTSEVLDAVAVYKRSLYLIEYRMAH